MLNPNFLEILTNELSESKDFFIFTLINSMVKFEDFNKISYFNMLKSSLSHFKSVS